MPREPFRVVIRRSDRPYFSFPGQLREGFQRFLQRRLRIVRVGLIQIDVVRLQPSQRILHRTQDIRLREPLLARAHLLSDLRGDEDLLPVPASLQPFAENIFGFAALVTRDPRGVDVRRVDQIAAAGGERVQQPERRFFIRGPSEDVASQRQRSDRKPGIPQFAFLFGNHGDWMRGAFPMVPDRFSSQALAERGQNPIHRRGGLGGSIRARIASKTTRNWVS